MNRLIRRLVVEYQVIFLDQSRLLDKEQPAHKFLTDRERGLPHRSLAHLFQNPFEHIGHLQGIRQIGLILCLCKRLQPLLDVNATLHSMMPSSLSSLVIFSVGLMTRA